jgi:hypothetical protein
MRTHTELVSDSAPIARKLVWPRSALQVEEIKEIISRLAAYLRAHDFAGYDPYDGLSSSVFNKLPCKNWKFGRLAIIHFNKRSPLNVRPILGISQGRNPKGIALCASSFFILGQSDRDDRHYDTARQLLAWLLDHQAQGSRGASWGYNFDWQSRTFFAPKNSPNAVCTIFAANAFLDAFDVSRNRVYLDVARSSCEFLLSDLLVRRGGELHFRYIPAQDTEIHNVNLLAAALLSRTATYTGDNRLLEVALEAVSFSVKRQREDGSWPYGEAANQGWVDHYHTGFNLVALSRYEVHSGNRQFVTAALKGYRFWDSHFFHTNGAPRFYPDCDYPVDIHCIAQAILTYLEYAAPDAGEKIERILRWARENMWASDGYFYFQRHRFYTNRIAYTRWGQAWMLYALSSLRNVLADCN